MLLCTQVESATNEQDQPGQAGKTRELRAGDRVMEINLFDLQILLAITSLQPDAYGKTILEELNRHTRRLYWPGRAYAALDRLEQEGLIKKTLECNPTPKRGGRRKAMLRLTTAGQSTLARSLNSIDSLRGMSRQASA
jgi:PadR family transcriptional regulator PadR